MQAIRAGDLYFLESPIHTDNQDSDKEKYLAYLLGTISARPVVVIRPPEWWDHFDTVTVIPALTKGNPAYVCQLYDRHGNITPATYPFIPHQPYTVPVSRLGRHIGSLDEDELDELLYAFHWIHDPRSRKKRDVPKMYREVMSRKCPPGAWRTGDPRCHPDIQVDTTTGTLSSETHSELNGLQIERCKLPEPTAEEYNKVRKQAVLPMYYEDGTPLVPISHDKMELVSNLAAEQAVPVEKPFPPSSFDLDTLMRIVGRFTFNDEYYNQTITTRNPEILTDHEIDTIRFELAMFDYYNLVDVYKTFTPMDAFVLGPRLPTKVLGEICKITGNQAAVLKRLCNYMRDMSADEYNRRARAYELSHQVEPNTVEDLKDPDEMSEDDIRDAMVKIKPYLNPRQIQNMPPYLSAVFMKIPKYIVKKSWTAPQFDRRYSEAIQFYRKRDKSVK